MSNINCVKRDDLRKCAELYLKVFNAEPWNDEWTFESAYNRLNDIFMSPNFAGAFYEEDDEIKGAVFGNCEHWYQGMHYNLKEIFVSAKLQGSGIGSKLLKDLEERLKKLDVNTILLFTSKENRTNHFYLRNSFDVLEDMVMMIKNI